MNKIQEWEEWVSHLSPKAQVNAHKYPPGTKFDIHGQVMHVISYSDDGGIGVTKHDPVNDYILAEAELEPICPCCLDKLDSLKLL